MRNSVVLVPGKHVERCWFFDGDGDGGAAALDASNPQIKALIDAAVSNATSGLTKNRDDLLREKKELQAKFEDSQKQWGGLDPEVVKNLVARMQNDEETKLIAEGKVDEVIQRRTGAMKKDLDSRLEAALKKSGEFESEVRKRDERIRTLLVEGAISSAASKVGLVPHALDDAVMRAKNHFSLADDGGVVARDGAGALIMGKDGRTPMTVAEWLDGMRETAPHWFPPSEGAGATGGSGAGRAKTIQISRTDAQDASKYQAAKAAAEKAKVPLVIVN